MLQPSGAFRAPILAPLYETLQHKERPLCSWTTPHRQTNSPTRIGRQHLPSAIIAQCAYAEAAPRHQEHQDDINGTTPTNTSTLTSCFLSASTMQLHRNCQFSPPPSHILFYYLHHELHLGHSLLGTPLWGASLFSLPSFSCMFSFDFSCFYFYGSSFHDPFHEPPREYGITGIIVYQLCRYTRAHLYSLEHNPLLSCHWSELLHLHKMIR